MKRTLGVVLATLAAGAALAGVLAKPRASVAAEAPRGGTLRVSSADEFVASVDPALGYDPGAWLYASATCAKLFNYPDKPGAEGARIVPEVADRTTISSDRRTHTFDLRRTFRFHTGAPVTAQSFADAINRLADPRLKSPASAAGDFDELVGASAVIAGTAQKITGVRVLDAANRLTGEARQRALADLDVALMRDDPPLVPTVHRQRRVLVSPSVGCVLPHPVYGLDLATACKKR